MSSSLEDEIRSLLIAHLETGTERGLDTLENFMDFVSEDYSGIGTGPNEFMRDKDTFREITREERKVMTYEVDFDLPTYFARILRPDLVLAEGEMLLRVDMQPDIFKIEVRFSILFEQQNNKWLITHSHYSVPDYRLDAGDTLMDALKARNAELQREVALRTADLNKSVEELKAAQTQLVHQEKMASLGALTAGIAHEIKNPLNFITNFARLSVDLAEELEEEVNNGEDVTDLLVDLKHNAAAISKHGQRADLIVRNMMRHASGKTGDMVETNVIALLEDYITLAFHGKKAQQPDFSCTIVRNFDDTIPPIQAIPNELGRVFLNILSNAFDALMDTPNPQVSIAADRTDHGVRLVFSDNGPGIDSEIIDKIFEPFFTTKQAGSGTGLGLSLSYDIITEGHNGAFKAGRSASGGAEFIIELPG